MPPTAQIIFDVLIGSSTYHRIENAKVRRFQYDCALPERFISPPHSWHL
jgi:hypothetical protein